MDVCFFVLWWLTFWWLDFTWVVLPILLSYVGHAMHHYYKCSSAGGAQQCAQERGSGSQDEAVKEQHAKRNKYIDQWLESRKNNRTAYHDPSGAIPAHDREAIDSAIVQVQSRSASAKPPEDAASSGWCDVSIPEAKIWIHFDTTTSSVTTNINMRTEHQQPNFPFFNIVGDEIRGGALPIFWAIGEWPIWFPFCESATPVAELTPDQAIWHLQFKFSFLTIDCVVLCCIIDSLDSDASVSLLMTSPPNNLAGETWLGVAVPEKSARFRIGFDFFRATLKPDTMSKGQVSLWCKMAYIKGLSNFYKLFFKCVSWVVIPLVARMERQFSASPIDAFYNDTNSVCAQRRAFFLQLFRRFKSVLPGSE